MMRWFLALPLIPLLFCGAMCAGGLVVAFVVGRKADGGRPEEPASDPSPEEVG